MNIDLRHVFRVLITPGCWWRLERTNKAWDKALLSALQNRPVIKASPSDHTVFINDVEVWVSNYPYSYGYPYPNRGAGRGLPSRKTAFLLHDMLGSPAAQDKPSPIDIACAAVTRRPAND